MGRRRLFSRLTEELAETHLLVDLAPLRLVGSDHHAMEHRMLVVWDAIARVELDQPYLHLREEDQALDGVVKGRYCIMSWSG
jgi:hypothetical protein